MTMVDIERDSRWAELRRYKREGKEDCEQWVNGTRALRAGDWQGALAACSARHDPLLLWLQPTRDVLSFIGEVARRLGIRHLVSVGCGSGLFEWLLASATGLEVKGLEVNRGWWESRYSPPTFLNLVFPDDDRDHQTVEEELQGREDAGIMFCYFNDTSAFLAYLGVFRGRALLVAGPGPGRTDAHCHPQPFCASIPAPWTLHSSAAIGSTGDFVAVYTRCDEMS
ncbi:Tyrosine-protein phosphatase non-receptor type 7 [Frankliniella fusca]|uniref:Tyrosine-protein phosphatase non-receptor type 7 n=1 Tax=Frankliniella fusca TaxID=407009 RepID=A0AAE1HXP9_9NEOP|nr:Tyrosine-protein phosphatase non-receptor type 7 [Frankliniella fusca]